MRQRGSSAWGIQTEAIALPDHVPWHGLVEEAQRLVKVGRGDRRRSEDVAEEGGAGARVGREQDHLRHGEPQLRRQSLSPLKLCTDGQKVDFRLRDSVSVLHFAISSNL